MSGTETLLAELARLANGPLTAATAMPPGLYHDPAIFARERDRLFAHELALRRSRGGDPQARRLPHLRHRRRSRSSWSAAPTARSAASSNVCLHRMMRLVEGRGSARASPAPITPGPMHLQGQLMGAPHMKPQPRASTRTSICLPEIRTEIWEGWIYVTLDPEIDSVARNAATAASRGRALSTWRAMCRS